MKFLTQHYTPDLINGGTILNIVPNLCQFEFEIRHLAEDDPKEIMQRIHRIC
jgi:acetylornithine deacetylase